MSEDVRVVVVTGLSGAGKSTALNSLEDLGYFCVDNLPTTLLERTVEVCEAGGIHRVALGVDVRVGSFLDGAAPAVARIAASNRDLVVLFLDASDESIIRRYSESRRPHPLAGGAREGMRADLNVIDYQKLALLRPEKVNDLPSATGRLIQRSKGYTATLVAGEVVVDDGELTDARPGRLVRSTA